MLFMDQKDLDMKTPTRKDSSDEEDLDDAEMEDAINDKTPMPDRELITLKMVAKWKKGLEVGDLFSTSKILCHIIMNRPFCKILRHPKKNVHFLSISKR